MACGCRWVLGLLVSLVLVYSLVIMFVATWFGWGLDWRLLACCFFCCCCLVVCDFVWSGMFFRGFVFECWLVALGLCGLLLMVV